MWENPITQENLTRLGRGGQVSTIGPDAGDLACGWIGAGRMVKPEEIVTAATARLGPVAVLPRPGVLAGLRVVVTAGPTWEAVDDVRFLGNRSSGKMGFALAAAAAGMGADVTLIAGPVALPTPAAVGKRVDVESALEMRAALHKQVALADVVVMAAAVADFRPGVRVLGKLSRRDGKRVPPEAAGAIPLVPNPDLLAELGRARKGRRPYLVGFAAEVGVSGAALAARARHKLREKACDVVVANEVGRPGIGFAADHNAVTLVFADGRALDLPAAHKDTLARAIWDRIRRELSGEPEPSGNKAKVRPATSRAKGKHA